MTLLVFNIEHWVDFYRIARTGLARTPRDTCIIELLTIGHCAGHSGNPGGVDRRGAAVDDARGVAAGTPLGARVGALLTWNTLGAVVGILITGFVLMPGVGLRNAFGVLALVLAVVALLLALRRGRPAGIAGAFLVCLFVGSLFVFSDASWQYV